MKRLFAPNFAIIAILLAFCVLATLAAQTNLPWCDEGWFASPAINLAERGFFGTTVLDETATFRQVRLDGINRLTFWIMPLYPLALAGWFKIVGFGLLEARYFSILCGAACLLGWFSLVKNLTGKHSIAVLTAAFLALDFHFVRAASVARMDMLTAALGVWALAAFLILRERNLTAAIGVSGSLAALAFFAHPLGLLGGGTLILLIAAHDWRKIKIKYFVIAAAPFLILAAAWAAYIAPHSDLFFVQFGGNASDRWQFFRAPVAEIWREIEIRYFYNFGWSAELSAAGRIRIALLLVYFAGFVAVIFTPSLRRERANQFLLAAATTAFFSLIVLDSFKQTFYLVYIVPFGAAFAAIFAGWLWQQKLFGRVSAAMVLAIAVAVNLSATAVNARRDSYFNNFLPAARFLDSEANDADLIFASAEFFFAVKPRDSIVDDYRLGFVSGKRARFVVMDKQHYEDWTNVLQTLDRANFEHNRNLLANEYELIYEDAVYQIYRRKPAEARA